MLSNKLVLVSKKNTTQMGLNMISRRLVSSTSTLPPMPEKALVDMAYDLHLPERSVIGKMPYHLSEPVIFIHGLFGSKRNYKNDCQKIATALQTPVYTVDVRCHGVSEHAFPFNYETLSNDLFHFIDKHQLGKVNLVGYSLGGKIAMLSLLRDPKYFHSALIIDNSPVDQPEILPFLKVFVKACIETLTKTNIYITDKSWRSKANEYMKKFIPNARIRGYLLNNIINKTPKGKAYKSPVVDYADGKIHWKNPVQHMKEVGVTNVAEWPGQIVENKHFLGPVGFIRGTKSAFIGKKSIPAINSYFPYNSITDINATHFILNERPSEYVRDVCNFFKTTRPVLEQNRIADEAVISEQQPSKNMDASV